MIVLSPAKIQTVSTIVSVPNAEGITDQLKTEMLTLTTGQQANARLAVTNVAEDASNEY